ncbi:MAG: hypothetical protein CAF44_014155 [Nitrospira sp. CG24D]|nr:MAG: hypothetical protein CAF44_014155 [Nitrospira sp. CG24D]
MSVRHSTTGVLLLSALIGIPLPSHAAEAMNGRIEIIGEYRYAARESESVADAKALACREAWRQAITTSPLYREQTAAVVDSELLRQLADSLAARYAAQVVEETERRQTVFCKVRGTVPKDDMAFAIRTQLAGGVPVAHGVEQNRALRILSVREENGVMLIQYQALKRLDWLGTHYQGGLRESADIMVDFYDEQGLLMKTERYPARRTATGDDVMNPGAIAVLKVTKPAGSKTYRAWLVK